ncbi:MAG: SHOCT domain-containing protein [Anaerolineae bacterium]|nr:SHOCT domain-containing protein [Anaerolineae bacterium]
MLAFWVIVIGGGVWLAMTLVRGNQATPASNQSYALMTPPAASSNVTALDLLKARYAKGELTKAQFEEMRRDLDA